MRRSARCQSMYPRRRICSPDTTVSTTAIVSTSCWKPTSSAVHGSSTNPTAQYCVNALYLPSRCAGSTTPRRPAIDRYAEMPSSRAAISRTGHQGNTPRSASTAKPPSTISLSATGSRNAPERVAPSRRASHPSTLSVAVIANHSATVRQLDPSSRMSANVGIATRIRVTVTKFAGVTSAPCPKRLLVARLGGRAAAAVTAPPSPRGRDPPRRRPSR